MDLRQIGEAIIKLSPDEQYQLEQLIARGIAMRRWPRTTKLEIIVTRDCNLACDYCWMPKETGLHIDDETAKDAVDFLLDGLHDTDSPQLTLFGGEPLLFPDLLIRIIEYANMQAQRMGKAIGWSITTNGTLITDEIAEFLSRHGILLLLSFDGLPAVHDSHRKTKSGRGSFDTAAQGVATLSRYQPWIGARVTTTPESAPSLRESIRVLREMGVRQFLLGVAEDVTWHEDQLGTLIQSYRECFADWFESQSTDMPYRIHAFEHQLSAERRERRIPFSCEGGMDKLAVDIDGSLYPCSRFLDQRFGDRFKLGTLQSGPTRLGVREEVTDPRIEVRQLCMLCAASDGCGGGCPAVNYKVNGSLFYPTSVHCSLARTLPDIYRELVGKHGELEYGSARPVCSHIVAL